MEENKNELIIIGGNHHNTLSVIRSFGMKKINFKLLIHENKKNINNLMICHSKFAKNITVLNNDETEILNYLLENKSTKNKQVIIPCSDLAEYVIDNNFDKLSKYYYISGFKNNPGLVSKLMDKYEQKKWADQNGIQMAKSWLVNLQGDNTNIKEMCYPCIVKPNVSVMGQKADITICNNEDELRKCLKSKYCNYKEVIIQQFIIKKYELLAMGYISDTGYKAYGVERKIRETIPNGGGSTALGRFINDPKIINTVEYVLKKLFNDGYRGLFDIEFFECDDKIYLNEINFRHSGSGFALIDNGINAPYLYYLDCMNINHDNKYKLKHNTGFFFCDIGEYNLYRQYKTITFMQFVFDFVKSYSHSIFNIHDLKVIYYCIKKEKR